MRAITELLRCLRGGHYASPEDALRAQLISRWAGWPGRVVRNCRCGEWVLTR